MCEQTEIVYMDGEVVWVKLGSCWWPGEVVSQDKLPPDALPSFRKPPVACVKFFQEDAYEYVKNINNIYKYNCSRKNEFINKGLYLYRTRHGPMEKFPDDVIRAETAVGGDIEILTRDEFQETKKESYAGLFGNPKKTPASTKKGKSGRGRPPAESPNISTPRRQMKEKTDYKVHILVQGSKPPSSFNTSFAEVTPTPSTSGTDATTSGDKPQDENTNQNEDKQTNDPNNTEHKEIPMSSIPMPPSTPLRSTQPVSVSSGSGVFSCHACPFTTTRLNVLIMHNKTHSVTFVPYTPSPVRKKAVLKSPKKSALNSPKISKPRKPRKEKSDKPPKKLQAKKRTSGEKGSSDVSKKPKTDEEIKSSLLADWDDDVDDDSNDESSTMVSAHSPEVPVGAESPAVPTPAELPSAHVPVDMSPVPDKKSNSSPSTEKPESSSDSKYEFCEDEDWPEEADIGRKIPRVKNPIRTEDPKNVIDDDEVAREVAELLNKTAVPELPSVPEPLRIEENFPEPSIVKSPDKSQDKGPEKVNEKNITEAPPTKAIFKTKTFFRSRHSRSQDAIGKYVAEQLNAVERMDISDIDLNGSEAVSSPEARDSPPIEPVKVARLAPKIQLKKMKAEAAQLREKEKLSIEKAFEPPNFNQLTNIAIPHAIKELPASEEKGEINECKASLPSQPVQDQLFAEEKTRQIVKDTLSFADKTVDIDPLHFSQLTNIPHAIKELPIREEKDESNKCSLSQPVQDLFYVEQKTSEVIKDTLPFENKTVQKYDSVNNIQVNENTFNFEQESPKYEEEPSQSQEKLNDFTENITELDREITRNEKALQMPVFEQEISEFEKELPNYSQGIHTSEFVNETTISEERERVFDDETPQHEDQAAAKNDKISSQRSSKDTEIQQELILNQESEMGISSVPDTKLSEPLFLEKEEHSTELLKKPLSNDKPQDQMELFMNESTASAVDALLSVSRETDRVPRVVTNDLPEDLFEEDKDTDSIEHEVEVSNEYDEKTDISNSFHAENGFVEHMETEEINNDVKISEIEDQSEINLAETIAPEISHNEEIIATDMDVSEHLDQEENNIESVVENIPSESDLQVAEALINLPATAIRSKTPTEHKENLIGPFVIDQQNNQEEVVPTPENAFINDTEIGFQENEIETETVDHPENVLEDDNLNAHFETEHEKSENLNENPDNVLEDDNLNARFETEHEKSENLNAAQSLVQMSESIEHKMNIVETMDAEEALDPNAFKAKHNNGIDISVNSIEQNVALLSNDNSSERIKPRSILDQSTSKLLKILEEPCKPKLSTGATMPAKQVVQGKEKILNFDVAKSVFKSKTPKQKIIIRRNPTNKTVLNKVSEVSGADKIILSRSGSQAQEGSSMRTFTIQTSPDTPSDANTIIIQQKIRKTTKPAIIQPKLQKIKPQTSLVAPVSEVKTTSKTQANDETMFDINSMPIVLSEDLLTPESIEKMPVVMSDGNVISQPQNTTKVIKPKQNVIEQEKVVITSSPHKSEVKTLLLNPGAEATKSMTPNILSKSSKLRGAKPMLVIDKATGKQKIIMTKSEPIVKELKQTQQTIIQPAAQAPKTEKFLILPTQNQSPRPTRTQKIVIDPQTGKAHMLVAKNADVPLSASDNKPVSAKLVPSNSEVGAPGNTVMIITNAQGAQSRIVLTPRHEKILFPNKQQPKVPQLKTISHRITPTSPIQKTVVTSIAAKTPTISPVKPPTRIVPKQSKSAIITSKGQLIVGGRVATTAHNIAPMPELRPVPSKRVVTSEPKKMIQTVQKSNSEPIIFLQQKSGAVMQLTAAQFEELQRTGQIVQKVPSQLTEKVLVQKPKSALEPGPSVKRGRRPAAASPTPVKKAKHEISIAPAPPLIAPAALPLPVPPLVPTASAPPAAVVPVPSNVVSITSGPTFTELDNFEEMLPSTAIARQQATAPVPAPEPVVEPPPALAPAPAPCVEPAPAPAITEQLLAVPGEHFGALAGTFYLCVEENGGYTPIDNRPLVLENNQLVPMETVPAPAPERRDILEAALANSDVFHAEGADGAPDFRDLNANVSVHCRVSETSTTLHQPIMTPVEVPSSAAGALVPPASLEAGLAVIGVTAGAGAVPTSLELPITVTDPRIAPRPQPDPLAASMPLLADEEAAAGKSMPILTDAGELDAASAGWSRLRTSPSDSDASLEIPLQPALQLSVSDLDRS